MFDIHVKHTELCELMQKHGSDKGHPAGTALHNYSIYYHALFNPMRAEIRRVFEIGVLAGSSLRAWKDYFPNAAVFGADIEPGCMFSEPRIQTFLCDQTNADSIANMWAHADMKEPMDVILDDGVHWPPVNGFFFERSFQQLRSGGVYIIEDLYAVAPYQELLDGWLGKFPIDDARILELPNHISRQDNKLLVMRKS